MDNTLKIVYDTISEQGVIKKGTHVTAALSGGADSVCLLMMLCELKETIGFALSAVHINHMIRGEESDRDENFCRGLCDKNNIPLSIFRENIPEMVKTSGKSLEETAREVRYKRFFECAGKNGIIATAHTLSDNAETVLLNLIRGTGLKGLCGIPQIRGNIVRPLINITREQVEGYLKSRGQSFVTDSTNLSDDYTRNKIRHLIIPQMQEINGGFYKSFGNALKALRLENSHIEREAAEALKDRQKDGKLNISGLDETIKRRLVSLFLDENGLPISYDNIERISALADKDGRINIKKDTFIVGKGGVIFTEKAQKPMEDIEKPLIMGDNTLFEGITLRAELSDKMTSHRDFCIDADKVQGQLVLRNRRFGDRVQLIGREFTSSVKKLLNEKVDKSIRNTVHFIADDEGIVFMEHFGIADRVKTDDKTERFLNITIDSR